jgi:hypothetical protein
MNLGCLGLLAAAWGTICKTDLVKLDSVKQSSKRSKIGNLLGEHNDRRKMPVSGRWLWDSVLARNEVHAKGNAANRQPAAD